MLAAEVGTLGSSIFCGEAVYLSLRDFNSFEFGEERVENLKGMPAVACGLAHCDAIDTTSEFTIFQNGRHPVPEAGPRGTCDARRAGWTLRQAFGASPTHCHPLSTNRRRLRASRRSLVRYFSKPAAAA